MYLREALINALRRKGFGYRKGGWNVKGVKRPLCTREATLVAIGSSRVEVAGSGSHKWTPSRP